MDQGATWYRGRPRPKRHCFRWGPSFPLPQNGAKPPQFSAHVYCGPTAAWIKMPLGMEVGLDPGHIVLDGAHPPSAKKGAQPGPCLLCPNGWMDQDATWCGDRPRRKGHRVRRGPLLKKEAEPPNFWPMSVVAKRLDGSRCHLVRWYATLC